jgi:hypothetical protein
MTDIRDYYLKWKHNQRHNNETRTFLEYYRSAKIYIRTKKMLPERIYSNINNFKFIISHYDNFYLLKNLKLRIIIKIKVERKTQIADIATFKKNSKIIYISMMGINYGKRKKSGEYNFEGYKKICRLKNKIIHRFAAYFAAVEKMDSTAICSINNYK